MSPSLSVVADNDLKAPRAETGRVETVAERVRRLQAEARQLAKDHVGALIAPVGFAVRRPPESTLEPFPVGVHRPGPR